MDWTLRDVSVGLQGGKTFCASLITGSMRAFLFVNCVCVVLWEFWLRLNEIHEVRTFSCKAFLFVVVFSSLEKYFEFRTTNISVKTDHSVSLRWNKTFWTFPKRFVFFWLCIRFVSWFCVQCFAFFRRAELKPACILLLVVTVTSFTRPDLFTFGEPALSLSSVKEP